MEDQFEGQGEVYGTPGWPNPSYFSIDPNPNYYDNNVNEFANQMYFLTMSFKSHNESYWPCKYFCVCMTDWIDPSCRQVDMRYGWWTFW